MAALERAAEVHRVLVIDDSPLALALVRETLETAGFVVETASDGREGLARMSAFTPNVVVSDLDMPQMNGVEVVAALKDVAPTVPVLIFSEMSQVDAAVAAMRTGAFGYVLKGAAGDVLVREVRAAIELQALHLRNAELEAENRRYQQNLERMVEAKAEELVALREAQAKERLAAEGTFRLIIENAPDPIGVQRDGIIVAANPALATLLGFASPSELLGLSVAQFRHPTGDVGDPVSSASEPSSREASAVQEHRVVAKDGRVMELEVRRVPVVFEGSPATLTLAKDVTQAKQTAARMAQVERLAAVGSLAAGVAHEINNPLAYVSSNVASVAERLTRLAKGHIDPADIEDALEAAQDSLDGIERVKQIVRDLKGLSRDEDKKGSVNLREVLQLAGRMASATIRPRARFVQDLGEEAMVFGNDGRLCQVFLNLLANAAQAIPEDQAFLNEVRVVARRHAHRATVEISDTGCGIPADVMARLFQPFFTTKPQGIGTGLGLSICQGIVTAHGGCLTVESEVGKGTTFRVELPLSRTDVQSTG